MAQNDKTEAMNIAKKLEEIDPDFAEEYNIELGLVPKPEP